MGDWKTNSVFFFEIFKFQYFAPTASAEINQVSNNKTTQTYKQHTL